jgi:hypothetical protein
MVDLCPVGCILESLFDFLRQLSPLAGSHAVELAVILLDSGKEGLPLRQPICLE